METEVTKIDVQGIPETTLQAVYARAKASQAEPHYIEDEKSVEIVSQLDYDFSHLEGDANRSVLARTILLDRMVEEFLTEHPDTVVLNIACGLDARCERMAGKYAHWYNWDVPQVIALRRKLFSACEQVTDLDMPLSDKRLGKQIIQTREPVLVIMEGVTMYLAQTRVQELFAAIRSRFAHCTVFVEAASPRSVPRPREDPEEERETTFKWGVKSGAAMQSLIPAFRCVKDVSLVEGMKVFAPMYKFMGKLGLTGSANKILVFEK